MNALVIILIYLILGVSQVIILAKKKEKKEIFVNIIIMLIPMMLSLGITVGYDMPSVNSMIRALFSPLLKLS